MSDEEPKKGEIVQTPPATPIIEIEMKQDKLKRLASDLDGLYKGMTKDTDYGTIPGTFKPTLFKPGAEILCMAFNLLPEMEIVSKIEDYDQPFFDYTVKCSLTSRKYGVKMGDGMGCLPPRQAIMTENGPKNIEDVRIGERVLTHCGRYMPVKNTFSRWYSGEVVSIKTRGASDDLILTPNHEVLNIPRIVGGSNHLQKNLLHWLSCAELSIQNYLVYPVLKAETDRESVLLSHKYYHNFSKGDIEKIWQLNVGEDLLSIMGYYLGEGFTKDVGSKAQAVQFAFGKTEKEHEYALNVVKSTEKLGMKASIWFNEGWRVKISRTVLANFLAKNLGRGAKHKFIAHWIKRLPRRKLKYLFRAYLDADGHRVSTGTEFSACTVSRQLAFDIRDIALKLDCSATVHKVWQSYENLLRKVREGGFIYTIRGSFPNASYHLIPIDKDFQYLRVQSVKSIPYTGFVYNLEVEEDNSYCTPNHILHNSANSGETRYATRKGRPSTKDEIMTLKNTLLKMAEKRALVDATLRVTAASRIFTQDLEDVKTSVDEEEEDSPPPAATPPSTANPAEVSPRETSPSSEAPPSTEAKPDLIFNLEWRVPVPKGVFPTQKPFQVDGPNTGIMNFFNKRIAEIGQKGVNIQPRIDGNMLEAIHCSSMDEEQLKDLDGALRWALSKIFNLDKNDVLIELKPLEE